MLALVFLRTSILKVSTTGLKSICKELFKIMIMAPELKNKKDLINLKNLFTLFLTLRKKVKF